LNKVSSSEQLASLIESMVKSKLIPDRRLVMSIMDMARSASSGNSFMVKINAIYADVDNADVVIHPVMLDLYKNLKQLFNL
jgi:hypothetical protein